MSEVNPIGRTAAPNVAQTPRTGRSDAAEATPVAGATRPSDKVELSDMAKLLQKLHALPQVRPDLVQRVKSEIAAGSYDTPDKVDSILNDVLEDL